MGNGAYLTILFFGALIVILDGQLILRNAPAYLAESYRDATRARRVAALVVVFFLLVMLGLVALAASMDLPADADVTTVTARIGVILLLTAAGHGIAMVVLSRLRDQQTGTELAEAQMEAQREHAQRDHREHTTPADSAEI